MKTKDSKYHTLNELISDNCRVQLCIPAMTGLDCCEDNLRMTACHLFYATKSRDFVSNSCCLACNCFVLPKFPTIPVLILTDWVIYPHRWAEPAAQMRGLAMPWRRIDPPAWMTMPPPPPLQSPLQLPGWPFCLHCTIIKLLHSWTLWSQLSAAKSDGLQSIAYMPKVCMAVIVHARSSQIFGVARRNLFGLCQTPKYMAAWTASSNLHAECRMFRLHEEHLLPIAAQLRLEPCSRRCENNTQSWGQSMKRWTVAPVVSFLCFSCIGFEGRTIRDLRNCETLDAILDVYTF